MKYEIGAVDNVILDWLQDLKINEKSKVQNPKSKVEFKVKSFIIQKLEIARWQISRLRLEMT
jgi:hypothetical protein